MSLAEPRPWGSTVRCRPSSNSCARRTHPSSLSKAIQVLKFAGANPIIATASPHNTALLTSLGATHVIDRTLPADAILARLPELTSGRPLEFAFDTVSDAETMTLAYKALARGGALAVVLPDVIPEGLKVPGDGKRIAWPAGNVHLPENRATGAELFKRLTEWLEKGIIKVRRSWCSLRLLGLLTVRDVAYAIAQPGRGASRRACWGTWRP